jgi:fructosamine-3-kinase
MIPEAVRAWCQTQGFGEIRTSRGVSGGCINQGTIIETTSGPTLFLKTNPGAPADMFPREAEGLQALAVPEGPRLPQVFLVEAGFILLEDLQPARRMDGFWELFGRQLAALHAHTSDQYGFEHDNYIGSTPQPNPWTADGYEFFAEHRLRFQAGLAVKKRLLDQHELRQVEVLVGRLRDLIPEQPASLIHGDLWGGNALADQAGAPALIDPAAHFGWSEAELGMTRLFGGFPEAFYRAYQAVRPSPPGLADRLPIYNLYHLLNHLNLFGSGYYSQVKAILNRFA